MAQDSAFWDGTATGHAASTDVFGAPYSSVEYGDIYSKFLGSNAARGFVIPGYGNDYKVISFGVGIMTIAIGSGACFIRGKICENTATTAVTFTASDATNPRLDRLILRIDWAAQTIVLAALAGTAAATPSVPALTQNATTYEIPLYTVWIPATVTTLTQPNVSDDRIFAANFESLYNSFGRTNLLSNSEFMAFSRLSTVPSASAGRPDTWILVGTVTTFASATRPTQMSRGRAISITAGAATSGMSQTRLVKPSTLYSIRGLINVTAGDVGQVGVTTNSGAPLTITRDISRTGAWIEVSIYYTTESDATTLTLSLLGKNNTDVILFGQFLVVEGYQPGPFRQIRETIYMDHAVGDASWNVTAKSSATTTIDLDTDFQALILPGTSAVYTRLQANDSGSAAGVASLGLRTTGGALNLSDVLVNGIANDAIHASFGVAPVDLNNQFDIVVVATGAGTLDAAVRICGIET